jgi:hypothetical protein
MAVVIDVGNLFPSASEINGANATKIAIQINKIRLAGNAGIKCQKRKNM